MNTFNPASIPIDGRTMQLERLRELSLHQQFFSRHTIFLFVPESSRRRAAEAFMSARMKERAFVATGFQVVICRVDDPCLDVARAALEKERAYFVVQRPLTTEALNLGRFEVLNLDGSRSGKLACSSLTETVLRIVEPFVAEDPLSVGIAGSLGHFGREIMGELRGRGLEVNGCDLGEATRCLESARIVISAVGQPGVISRSVLKTPKEVLIDVGYTFEEATGRARGDFDNSCYELSRYHTPVPGGVGPLQVLTLVERAACKAGYCPSRPWALRLGEHCHDQETGVDP